MQLLIFMVEWCGDIKVAHHVQRGLAGLRIATVLFEMLLQTRQECQRALHTFMAGVEQFKWLLKTGSGRVETR